MLVCSMTLWTDARHAFSRDQFWTPGGYLIDRNFLAPDILAHVLPFVIRQNIDTIGLKRTVVFVLLGLYYLLSVAVFPPLRVVLCRGRPGDTPKATRDSDRHYLWAWAAYTAFTAWGMDIEVRRNLPFFPLLFLLLLYVPTRAAKPHGESLTQDAACDTHCDHPWRTGLHAVRRLVGRH